MPEPVAAVPVVHGYDDPSLDPAFAQRLRLIALEIDIDRSLLEYSEACRNVEAVRERLENLDRIHGSGEIPLDLEAVTVPNPNPAEFVVLPPRLPLPLG